MFDFNDERPLPMEMMKRQVESGYGWLKAGRIAGMLFVATPAFDVDLETVEWFRQWIRTHGDERLPAADARRPQTTFLAPGGSVPNHFARVGTHGNAYPRIHEFRPVSDRFCGFPSSKASAYTAFRSSPFSFTSFEVFSPVLPQKHRALADGRIVILKAEPLFVRRQRQM